MGPSFKKPDQNGLACTLVRMAGSSDVWQQWCQWWWTGGDGEGCGGGGDEGCGGGDCKVVAGVTLRGDGGGNN